MSIGSATSAKQLSGESWRPEGERVGHSEQVRHLVLLAALMRGSVVLCSGLFVFCTFKSVEGSNAKHREAEGRINLAKL
jgi:hypothetical protein